MTFPDTSLERTGVDPAVSAMVNGVPHPDSHPLSDEQRRVADREAPVGERIYAPASERVPVEPVDGHRAFVDHTDTRTPERLAAQQATEPPFTRVARPSAMPADEANSSGDRAPKMVFGLGVSWVTVAFCSVGAWLYFRWRQKRNRPINRLRRQARQAAGAGRQAAHVVRERVPTTRDEAVRPAAGLAAAVLSTAILVWQQSQARSREADRAVTRQATRAAHRAAEAAADVNWHSRLGKLKSLWTPGRLERERFTISRH